MKKMKIYQVDAFAGGPFSGNPAGVVLPGETWPDERLMQHIAMENNLAETAFLVPAGEFWNIRWFTPLVEVELCGHATLASAHVLFRHEGFPGDLIRFTSASGELRVRMAGELLTLDFPSDSITGIPVTAEMASCFGLKPSSAWKGRTDFMFVFEEEQAIRDLKPDFDAIGRVNGRGIIATAPGTGVDFVSRFFAPQAGIPEDPVTGSAHTTLMPYWSSRLGKMSLSAIQLSQRKGWLECVYRGERTEISGRAVTFLQGEICLD